MDRGYSWSMTTALPSIFRVMILTSPAFLSLNESNFWMTASATPMPVAYGCMVVSRRGRDQCDAWGRVMRGGVCRRVKMWNFSEAHAAGRLQANVCRQLVAS